MKTSQRKSTEFQIKSLYLYTNSDKKPRFVGRRGEGNFKLADYVRSRVPGRMSFGLVQIYVSFAIKQVLNPVNRLILGRYY